MDAAPRTTWLLLLISHSILLHSVSSTDNSTATVTPATSAPSGGTNGSSVPKIPESKSTSRVHTTQASITPSGTPFRAGNKEPTQDTRKSTAVATSPVNAITTVVTPVSTSPQPTATSKPQEATTTSGVPPQMTINTNSAPTTKTPVPAVTTERGGSSSGMSQGSNIDKTPKALQPLLTTRSGLPDRVAKKEITPAPADTWTIESLNTTSGTPTTAAGSLPYNKEGVVTQKKQEDTVTPASASDPTNVKRPQEPTTSSSGSRDIPQVTNKLTSAPTGPVGNPVTTTASSHQTTKDTSLVTDGRFQAGDTTVTTLTTPTIPTAATTTTTTTTTPSPHPQRFEYPLESKEQTQEEKTLAEVCKKLMANLQNGSCILTFRHSNGAVDFTSVEVKGQVRNSIAAQYYDEITKNSTDNKTLIAILASCGALLIMIVILGVCASHHRRPYCENQQHLTEELHTVENCYHDNPTLEVMEVQPEMQEKKVVLNGEFNDSWIVPIDNLLKEDIPDEEDTHL